MAEETFQQRRDREQAALYRASQDKRRVSRQVAYQNELNAAASQPGYIPPWRQAELDEQDRIDRLWARHIRKPPQ